MPENFDIFIQRFKDRLYDLFHNESNINELSLQRGLPDDVWDKIMDLKPLSVAIPAEYGGRGCKVSECLSLLAAASYEALPLSLTFGINIALFLEPMAKYGNLDVKPYVFDRFLNHKAMGGLMITEPDFGSDALNMQTSYEQEDQKYHITGQKHWQGLTGMADFWLVAARSKNAKGELARDIDFFLTENEAKDQHIQVEHYFNNLGLYMIPYGLNIVDVKVPLVNRMLYPSTGIKMMLDILHRSRFQFPGMGMGFIQRMLDEALTHCTNRIVGGVKLLQLDSVRYQLSRIQASFAICSGMCAKSSRVSGIDQDLATAGMEANSMKALVTDLMQESAQICVQLAGSSGYKIDHIGGRGIVDSRPFQIFEGSNEMLYTQIAEQIIKQMKKVKELNFATFLNQSPYCAEVVGPIAKDLNFTVPAVLQQRQMIAIGRIVARLVCLQYVADMVSKGFRKDLYENATKHMHADIRKLLTELASQNDAAPVVEYHENANWADFI